MPLLARRAEFKQNSESGLAATQLVQQRGLTYHEIRNEASFYTFRRKQRARDWEQANDAA